MSATTKTPSERRGIHVTPRLPPFAFDDLSAVPDDWFAGDPGTTAVWNALSVLASVLELRIIDAGRWLVERIEDDAIADETRRFLRQESYHATVHDRFNKLLAARGLPVEPVRQYLVDVSDAVIRLSGLRVWSSMILATEQLIGEIGHAGLANMAALDGAAPAPRALWLWHFYEEVEHQPALHDGWVTVFGNDRAARDLRVLGAAYVGVIIALVWPVAALAMLPAWCAAVRFRGSTWAPVLRQMFGRRGLLRGAARNLRGLARVGFHPFENHDPVPTLQRWRDTLTDPTWERPISRRQPHGQRAGDAPPACVELGDAWRFGRFVRFALRRSLALGRELRAAGA